MNITQVKLLVNSFIIKHIKMFVNRHLTLYFVRDIIVIMFITSDFNYTDDLSAQEILALMELKNNTTQYFTEALPALKEKGYVTQEDTLTAKAMEVFYKEIEYTFTPLFITFWNEFVLAKYPKKNLYNVKHTPNKYALATQEYFYQMIYGTFVERHALPNKTVKLTYSELTELFMNCGKTECPSEAFLTVMFKTKTKYSPMLNYKEMPITVSKAQTRSVTIADDKYKLSCRWDQKTEDGVFLGSFSAYTHLGFPENDGRVNFIFITMFDNMDYANMRLVREGYKAIPYNASALMCKYLDYVKETSVWSGKSLDHYLGNCIPYRYDIEDNEWFLFCRWMYREYKVLLDTYKYLVRYALELDNK